MENQSMNPETLNVLQALGFVIIDRDAVQRTTDFQRSDAKVNCTLTVGDKAKPEDIAFALIDFGECRHRNAVREARRALDDLTR